MKQLADHCHSAIQSSLQEFSGEGSQTFRMDDDRVEVRHSLDEVLDEFKNSDEDLMICGGASIYKQALGVANRMLLSRIPGKHEGDTYFPDIKQSGLKLSEKKPFDTFTLEIYER